jgi:predicted GNAT family N-acyltransferase
LRHQVLRFGLPETASVYPEDELPTTFHLAATVDTEIVGCITVFPEAFEGEPGWRLRGMATADDRRGQGVGAAMLRDAQRRVVDLGGNLLWCNARLSAAGFYEGCGFGLVGPEFLGEMDIPHRKAVWRSDG